VVHVCAISLQAGMLLCTRIETIGMHTPARAPAPACGPRGFHTEHKDKWAAIKGGTTIKGGTRPCLAPPAQDGLGRLDCPNPRLLLTCLCARARDGTRSNTHVTCELLCTPASASTQVCSPSSKGRCAPAAGVPPRVRADIGGRAAPRHGGRPRGCRCCS